MGKEYEDKMLNRLDALIALSLKPNISESQMLEKVRILKDSGLEYKEIARILGSTPNSISVMFAKLNKEK